MHERLAFTYADYLAADEASPLRLEYIDGIVAALPGSTAERAGRIANLTALLATACEGRRCQTFGGLLRVRAESRPFATYPDVSVVCGHLRLDPDDAKGQTLVNPLVLGEVLSPTTEAHVRGLKLRYYEEIESLREVILVAHDDRRVDLWRRTKRGWTQLVFRDGESVELESLGCSLPVDEIYFDPLAG